MKTSKLNIYCFMLSVGIKILHETLLARIDIININKCMEIKLFRGV